MAHYIYEKHQLCDFVTISDHSLIVNEVLLMHLLIKMLSMAKNTLSSAIPLFYEEAVLLGFLIATQRDKEIEEELDEEGYFVFSIPLASGNLHIKEERIHKASYSLRDNDLLDIKFNNESPQMYCKVRTERLKKLALC